MINHLIIIIIHSKYFAISDYCSSNPLASSSQALGAYLICRHRSTAVSTFLQKSVRFFMIDISLIKKILSKLQGFIQGEWNWPLSCLNDSDYPGEGTLGEAYLGYQFRKLVSIIILDPRLMILKAIYTIDSMVYCLLLFTQNILLFLIVSNHYSMSEYWSPFDHLKQSCSNKAMWWPLKPGATFSIIIKLNVISDSPEKLSTLEKLLLPVQPTKSLHSQDVLLQILARIPPITHICQKIDIY